MSRTRRIDRRADRVIGQRLAEIRKEREMTQTELAEKLGVPQSIISMYESGKVRMYADVVAEVAKILHVSADRILGLQDLPANGNQTTSPRIRRMLEQIDRLPRRARQSLLHTLRLYIQPKAS